MGGGVQSGVCALIGPVFPWREGVYMRVTSGSLTHIPRRRASPETGLDVNYAPSRLAGVVGVPVRDQGGGGTHGGFMHSDDSADDGYPCPN